MKINVLGAGSWGTALSILLGRNGHEVLLHGWNAEDMAILRTTRENLHYLPGFVLPETVTPTSDDADLVAKYALNLQNHSPVGFCETLQC